jgi:hypothetical protein
MSHLSSPISRYGTACLVAGPKNDTSQLRISAIDVGFEVENIDDVSISAVDDNELTRSHASCSATYPPNSIQPRRSNLLDVIANDKLTIRMMVRIYTTFPLFFYLLPMVAQRLQCILPP